MPTAKIICDGDSQAVQLPQDFQFPPETQEVKVRREGSRIILEPMQREEDWPEEFWQAFGRMPEGFDRPGQRQP